jgi:hypothetical protein
MGWNPYIPYPLTMTENGSIERQWDSMKLSMKKGKLIWNKFYEVCSLGQGTQREKRIEGQGAPMCDHNSS